MSCYVQSVKHRTGRPKENKPRRVSQQPAPSPWLERNLEGEEVRRVSSLPRVPSSVAVVGGLEASMLSLESKGEAAIVTSLAHGEGAMPGREAVAEELRRKRMARRRR